MTTHEGPRDYLRTLRDAVARLEELVQDADLSAEARRAIDAIRFDYETWAIQCKLTWDRYADEFSIIIDRLEGLRILQDPATREPG